MTQEMKQYTGTKTVKAMPMTKGEAYEQELLMEVVKPSKREADKSGYLVEHYDGYQSWCPAETFEQAYKPSETVLDRLLIEYSELKERFIKLDRELSVGFDEAAKKIGGKHVALLIAQSLAMQNYLGILETRIIGMEANGDK